MISGLVKAPDYTVFGSVTIVTQTVLWLIRETAAGDQLIAGAAGRVRLVSLMWLVILVKKIVLTAIARSTRVSSEMPCCLAVSYTHLTLPTKA